MKAKIIINKFGLVTTGSTAAVEKEVNEILGNLNRADLVKIYMNNNRDVLIVWEEPDPLWNDHQ